MSAYLSLHVWDEIEEDYHRGNDFPSSLDIDILESTWNRGHYSGSGQHNVKDIQEMREDCCTYVSDLL